MRGRHIRREGHCHRTSRRAEDLHDQLNKQNAQTALAKLPIGGEVGSEIRNAVNAGKEVTVHEKSINKHGWKGVFMRFWPWVIPWFTGLSN